MKLQFKSFYLGGVLCGMSLSAQTASSHERMTPPTSASSFEQEMAESMSKWITTWQPHL
jgi:hypothetical protein